MSEQKVRSAEGLIGMAAGLVGKVSRVNLTIVSAPLVLLPKATRRRVRRAIAETARAVIVIPRELSDASVRMVDRLFEGEEAESALPRVEEVAERARGFTDRLAKAAEEFGVSVGRATRRAGASAEQVVAKVDEWVEKS